MAFNPPVSREGVPLAVYGESYILTRRGMRFTGKIPMLTGRTGSLKGVKGVVYLTTKRMCFVADRPETVDGVSFYSFDVPLANISEEKFNQPIFGANNLAGKVDPLPGMGVAGPSEWKLAFYDGGFSTFLHFFFRLVHHYRVATEEMRKKFITSVQEGAFARTEAAYIDPADPSVLYVTQPSLPAAYPLPPGAPGAPSTSASASTAPGSSAPGPPSAPTLSPAEYYGATVPSSPSGSATTTASAPPLRYDPYAPLEAPSWRTAGPPPAGYGPPPPGGAGAGGGGGASGGAPDPRDTRRVGYDAAFVGNAAAFA